MEDYIIVRWPEIQDYMEIDGFEDHTALITENENIGIGSCTYLVDAIWYDHLQARKSRK